MKEHKHAKLLRMAADNADQLFECDNAQGKMTIASVIGYPHYNWRPVEQPCQECENLKHDLESYMKMAHAYANQKPLSDDELDELVDFWNISDIDIKGFIKKVEQKIGR